LFQIKPIIRAKKTDKLKALLSVYIYNNPGEGISMILKAIHVQNYRSCKDIHFEFSPITSLVGANNAGKSTILRALDFFFNPSITKLSDESFWALDTTLEIRIEALFYNLSQKDIEKFQPYLRPDGTLLIARVAKTSTNEESETDSDSISTGKI